MTGNVCPNLLACVSNVVLGLPPVAVNGHEEDPLLAVLGRHVLEEVVVGVGVRTERRSKDDDDRLMVLPRLGQGKERTLNGLSVKAWNGASDLDSGRAGGKQEGENRRDGEVADEPTRSRRLPSQTSGRSSGSPASERIPSSFRKPVPAGPRGCSFPTPSTGMRRKRPRYRSARS